MNFMRIGSQAVNMGLVFSIEVTKINSVTAEIRVKSANSSCWVSRVNCEKDAEELLSDILGGTSRVMYAYEGGEINV